MKKKLRNSNVIRSILSFFILGAFIVIGAGSLFLLDVIPIERELTYVGDQEYQLKTEYTQYYKVKTGQRDQYGRWTGPIKYQKFDNDDNLIYTCEYTLKYGHLHGLYKVTDRYGNTEESCYDLGEKVPCNKSSLISNSDSSAFSVLEEKYSWYLDYFYGFEVEKDFIQSYLDTLEIILYSDNFDFEEFDDYYDDALIAIEETRFDTLSQLNTIFHYIDGTELLKNSEFRLALIDQYNAGKSSSYEVVEESYPNYLALMDSSGINNETFSIFCHEFDSIMATYGALDPEDPFFTDSIDDRSSRALTAILDEEVESSSTLVTVLKSAETQKNINSFKRMWHSYNSIPALLSINPASQEVALVVFVFMLTDFDQADKIKQSVKNAFIIKNDIVTLPTVTTNTVDSDSETNVTLTGNVIEDGGAEVTLRGIAWAGFHNPTINQNVTEAGSGTGTFSVPLEGLIQGETYYARAFARNSEGIAYGNNVQFTASFSSGISQKTAEKNFIIYPNPTSGKISIELKNQYINKSVLTVYNLSGQVVYKKQLGADSGNTAKTEVVLSLPDGLYQCKLSTDGKTIGTSKLVIAQ